MEQLLQTCIKIAQSQGFRAQGFAHHHVLVGYNLKTLTGETLAQSTLEKNMQLTLEKEGKKASRKFSYRSDLDPQQLVAEIIALLHFVTADSAESLPEIRDHLEQDVSKFTPEALGDWAKREYEAAKRSLEEVAKTSPFSAKIEMLTVSGSWSHSVFMNSYGARKVSTGTTTGFQIGFSGENNGVTDSEWLWRDSADLMTYNPSWSSICLAKLSDKVHPVRATFETGTYPIALDPDVASSCMDELLGFLSGYAIVEGMSPFQKADLGTKVLPTWATVSSFHTLPDAASAQFFDANGITTQDIVPIRDGVMETLFLSKASAERLQLVPNGQSWSINVRISGAPEKQDLLGVRFMFTNLAGMHTIDRATGNFALEGQGYEITSDGKIGSFVKNVGLSWNIKTLFGSLIGCLQDTPDYGGTRMPTLIFQEAQIIPTP